MVHRHVMNVLPVQFNLETDRLVVCHVLLVHTCCQLVKPHVCPVQLALPLTSHNNKHVLHVWLVVLNHRLVRLHVWTVQQVMCLLNPGLPHVLHVQLVSSETAVLPPHVGHALLVNIKTLLLRHRVATVLRVCSLKTLVRLCVPLALLDVSQL